MSDPKKSKEPGHSPEDSFRVLPNERPFTKYRAADLAVCGICVILGILYLYTDLLSLDILLPVYAAAFCAIPVLQFLDIKAAGKTGFVNYLPPIFWSVISIAVLIAAVSYFL